jgi:hypothetical protein
MTFHSPLVRLGGSKFGNVSTSLGSSLVDPADHLEASDVSSVGHFAPPRAGIRPHPPLIWNEVHTSPLVAVILHYRLPPLRPPNSRNNTRVAPTCYETHARMDLCKLGIAAECRLWDLSDGRETYAPGQRELFRLAALFESLQVCVARIHPASAHTRRQRGSAPEPRKHAFQLQPPYLHCRF